MRQLSAARRLHHVDIGTFDQHPSGREALLQRAKAAQSTLEWKHAYPSTRPKFERKIAHFVRAGWGFR